MAGMRFLTLSGTDIVSGQLHNLFPACRVGDAATIAYVQVLNSTGATLSNLRAYLRLDPAGVACSMAIADGTARAESYSYGTPTPPGSTPGSMRPSCRSFRDVIPVIMNAVQWRSRI